VRSADTARVLAAMGLRNLGVHRVKSLVVGAIMFFGVFLVVVGTAMLDSVETSMQRSITSSLAGQAQVYSADAKDDLSLFPMGSMGSMDYGELDDFPALRDTLMQVDNVKDVVPMGITNAIVFGTPQLDLVLEELRHAVERGDADAIATYRAHARAIARDMHRDVLQSMAVSGDTDKVRGELADLEQVDTDAFWQAFDQDPQGSLAFLDTQVAPLAMDGRLLYMRVIGTDLDQFSRDFSSFQVVQGSLPPAGQPGLMLSDRFYEKQVKDKVARDLDALDEGRKDGKTLADDAVLGLTAQRLPKQVQGLLYELAPADGEAVRARLSQELGAQGDLRTQLQALLSFDDGSFDRHYQLFYEVVAPHMRLYETPVGQDIVLRAVTRSGYQRAVSVRVWGTFSFTGLERSDLAGANNLVDLTTFRSLYGRMSDAQQAELAGIRAQAGVEDISRADAEDALFGGGPATAEPVPAEPAIAEAAPVPPPVPSATASDDDAGLALNAAVIMDDPTRVAQTITAMQAQAEQAGLHIKIIDWQQAAGIVGQLILVLKAVLTVAIVVIFLVALVIINNTMVMATMERTQEIGTMRAIGAQRSFVVALFVVETAALGIIAGGLGALLGAGFIAWLGQVGVPAVADILVLLFAGQRLYPTVGVDNVALGMGAIVTISLLSTLYPAALAARVPPVVAMQGKE